MRSIRRITLAAATAASQATVTIGSNLARTPQLGVGCVGSCTFGLSALDQPSFAAPNGVRSPVNGTVVRWRIRTGGSATSTSLRVVRPAGVNLFSGGATSASVTPALNSISEFPTSVPIQINDLIG